MIKSFEDEDEDDHEDDLQQQIGESMPIDEVNKVCFVGGGTMGCANSLVAAIAGYEAVVYDADQEALKRVPERQREIGALILERGLLNQGLIDAGLARITLISDPGEAAAGADLLSESVPERAELKREVHRHFDELCPPHTIMTTNTSSLLVTEIEDAVGRRDRFAAMHFHGISKLVDIVGGPKTSKEIIDTLRRFVRSLGGVPIVLKKEKDGYLHNTMFINLLKTGALLVIDGYSNKEDVDRSWMLVHQSVAGPFGMMDAVGLNVVLEVAEAQAKHYGGEEYKKMAEFIRPYVERGELGRKTGKGFYTYPDPIFEKPEFLQGENDGD
jgi:3-hydroxybutyryl-CoA dehydrogenase